MLKQIYTEQLKEKLEKLKSKHGYLSTSMITNEERSILGIPRELVPVNPCKEIGFQIYYA